jgi:cytochrome c-type biogenesis protein CcmH
MIRWGLLLLIFQANLLLASAEIVPFSDESLRPRYQQLIEELRCPKCQNQNLADSNSPISQDLREQVRRLLEEGLTDAEIKEYLKSRYSEFILYRPEVNQNTWLLWAAPVLFLIIGILVLYRLYFNSAASARAVTPEKNGLDSHNQQRLDELLQENRDQQ